MSELGEHKGDGIRYAMHLSAPKGGSAQMLRDPDGGWVSWEDYARLKAELTDLKSEADRFKAEVERLTQQVDNLIEALQKSHDEHAKALCKLKYKR